MYSILLAYEEIGKKPKPNANHVECSFDNMPGEDQFCQVKTSELITGPCTEDEHYGFDKGKPCILIKLNKVSCSDPLKGVSHICQWTLKGFPIDWLLAKLPAEAQYLFNLVP